MTYMTKVQGYPQLHYYMASAPPQSRRTGVWGDTVFNTAKEVSSSSTKLSPDTDDDIPVIPDLDELQEEEMASQVAQAPTVAVTRVATYKELDSDLFQHSAFASVDDVSLRLLTTHLHPEADIAEADVVWTWDALFSEAISQLPEQSSPVHASKEDIKPAA
ncbi:hypothetical protein B566_EDAN014913 [Ephemera danica]|nr:hypothetical protein B566_EDAN014913 [Ephemera danica]